MTEPGDHPRGERAFFRDLLGDDWETRFAIERAMARPESSDREVHAARERAVALCERLRADLRWDDELRDRVREAWFIVWVSLPDDS